MTAPPQPTIPRCSGNKWLNNLYGTVQLLHTAACSTAVCSPQFDLHRHCRLLQARPTRCKFANIPVIIVGGNSGTETAGQFK